MRFIICFLLVLLHGRVGLANPDFWVHEWPDTDFSKTEVPFVEILSGGPGKDGIPALSHPRFIPIDRANIPMIEPVISVQIGDAVRAYPVRYLIWHELVNDQIEGVPVLISFCPLCNSAQVFDRRLNGVVHSFGVTGKLRHSDMVMYDIETQSWWQQAIGLAIVGDMVGTDLLSIPSQMESLADFAARNPAGQVMEQPAFRRAYGRNPYVEYDTSIRPFLFNGDMPPHGIAPLSRVIRVGQRAWPMARLQGQGVIREAGVTIEKIGVQASALGTGVIASAATVPTVRVTSDDGTNVVYDVMFAFAFHAFFPQGVWMIEPPTCCDVAK